MCDVGARGGGGGAPFHACPGHNMWHKPVKRGKLVSYTAHTYVPCGLSVYVQVGSKFKP
jgi:hypothetical protein